MRNKKLVAANVGTSARPFRQGVEGHSALRDDRTVADLARGHRLRGAGSVASTTTTPKLVQITRGAPRRV